MKWVHQLNGRGISETVADVFAVNDNKVWRNRGYQCGGASWGVDDSPLAPPLSPMDSRQRKPLHCFHTMKEVLRCGFVISEGCIIPNELDATRHTTRQPKED